MSPYIILIFFEKRLNAPMDWQSDPEIRQEVARRRNSGDPRYDFIDDEQIAKEIFKEKDKENRPSDLLVSLGPKSASADKPKKVAMGRNPQSFLSDFFRWIEANKKWLARDWTWRIDTTGQWVDMNLKVESYDGLPSVYIDATYDMDFAKFFWLPEAVSIELLLLYLRDKQIISILDQKSQRWLLKITTDLPGAEFTCIRKIDNTCSLTNSKIVADPNVLELGGYRIGQRLALRPGREKEAFYWSTINLEYQQMEGRVVGFTDDTVIVQFANTLCIHEPPGFLKNNFEEIQT